MKGNSKRLILAILAAVTYLIMIAVNYLANALPIAGVTTAQRSDSYPNLFAPAGYTFAVWGLIYLLLAAFVLKELTGAKKPSSHRKDRYRNSVLLGFSLSCLINAAWMFAWHYGQIALAFLLMVLLFVCLIWITGILRQAEIAPRDALFIRVPFSVYLGWITAATIANATALLVALGWDGSGISEEIWTCVALAAGLLIGAAYILKNRDAVYGLVVIWAFGGILAKHLSAAGFDGAYPAVIFTAIACMTLLLVAVIVSLVTKRKG